jgi:hypothetical protein
MQLKQLLSLPRFDLGFPGAFFSGRRGMWHCCSVSALLERGIKVSEAGDLNNASFIYGCFRYFERK